MSSLAVGLITFREVGKSDPAALDISLFVIYEYDKNAYTSYLQEDLPKLWKILEQTGMIIGYNSDHFDIPLLDKYYTDDLTKVKSLDLLAEIHKTTGKHGPP